MNKELPVDQTSTTGTDPANGRDYAPKDKDQELSEAELELQRYIEATEGTVYPFESEDAEHSANSGRLKLENNVERLRKIAAGDDDATKMQKQEYEDSRNS